jgi:hypothetical protein
MEVGLETPTMVIPRYRDVIPSYRDVIPSGARVSAVGPTDPSLSLGMTFI